MQEGGFIEGIFASLFIFGSFGAFAGTLYLIDKYREVTDDFLYRNLYKKIYKGEIFLPTAKKSPPVAEFEYVSKYAKHSKTCQIYDPYKVYKDIFWDYYNWIDFGMVFAFLIFLFMLWIIYQANKLANDIMPK